jgi:hypothetical protein
VRSWISPETQLVVSYGATVAEVKLIVLLKRLADVIR